MTETPSIQALRRLIADLEARLEDLQNRMPAHSIPPALVAQLDDLDEQLLEARRQLAVIERNEPD